MISWLHLSDLHFSYNNHINTKIKDSLIDYITALNKKIDFVVITGDIAYKEKYDDALRKYIEKIAASINCDIKNIFACVGNHDIKRNNTRTATVNDCLNGYLQNHIISEEQYDYLFLTGHKAYNNKIKELLPGMEMYDKVHNFRDESEYSITILNTCLFSHNDNDQGNLIILDDKFIKILTDNRKRRTGNKINIAIGHHSYDWLKKEQQKAFCHAMVDENIDLYLCGHNHSFDMSDMADTDLKQFTTGSIYDENGNEKICFLVGEFNPVTISYTVSLHSYSSDTHCWDIDRNNNRKFIEGHFTTELPRLVKSSSEITNKYSSYKPYNFYEYEFQSIQLGIQKKSKEFIGYVKDLNKIKQDIEKIQDNPENGDYIFCFARELYGKSYFCSRLVYDLCLDLDTKALNMTNSGIIFVDGKRVNSISRMVEVIQEQSRKIMGYPLQLEIQSGNDKEIYQPIKDKDKITKILFELTKSGKKILIVIDALNEISNNEINFLPDVLPRGLCVLITSNMDIKNEIFSKEYKRELKGFLIEEIRHILNCNNTEFINKVYKNTKGCPHLILDIADSLKEKDSDITKVKITTSGKEYFDSKIKQWQSNIILEALIDVFRIFGYISPLSLDQLQAYLNKQIKFKNIKGEEITEALETVRNQLLIVEEENLKLYKVYYSLFVDRINERATIKDLRDCVENVTKWLVESADLFKPDILGRYYYYWITRIDEKNNLFLLDILNWLKENNINSVLDIIAASIFIESKEISQNTLAFFERYCDEIDSEMIYQLLCFVYSREGTKNVSFEKLNSLLTNLSFGVKHIWAKVPLGINLLDGKNVEQNKEEGEKLLRQAIKLGNDGAMNSLGWRLLDGDNVEQNKEEGEKLLRQAIKHDNVTAMSSLGWRLLDGKNVEQNKEEGEKLLRQAIKLGNVAAMSNLGWRLLDGKNVEQNKEEGEKLLRQATKLGNDGAMNSLGWRLLDGDNVEQNKEEGEKLLRQATKLGNDGAMNSLGWRLLDGKNVEHNKEEGEKLLRDAVKLGNDAAMHSLGWRLLDGKNVEQNKKEGEKLLRDAIKLGETDAMGNLGSRLLDGKNVEQNKEEGEKILRDAVKLGNDAAMHSLGWRLLNGENVEQNKEEGEKLLRDAVKMSNTNAMAYLGSCLMNGENIEQNKEEGEKLLRDAMELGNNNAINSLAFNLYLCGQKPRSADLFYKGILKDNSVCEINLAYMIRKEEYPSSKGSLNVEELLHKYVFTDKPDIFASINYALFIVASTKDNIIWNNAEDILSKLNIYNKIDFKDAVQWWSALSNIGDLEGDLIIGWLSKLGLIDDINGLSYSDRFKKLLDAGMFIPASFLIHEI